MALSASTLGNLIAANLTSAGANGSNKTIFSNSIAAGIVMSISGKSFTTTDAGSMAGSGIGIGSGITGLSSSTMSTLAISAMSSTGSKAVPMMNAIMSATVAHLSSSAALNSTHTPIFAGVGSIDVGSISVTISEMSTNIETQLRNAGANGSNLHNFCHAVATGICTNILSAGTGSVTITGSPIGTPSPGAGVGVGVIT
jgi:hypothetical protein